MKTPRIPSLFLVFTATCFLLLGCASPDVNPPEPRANTGYVDFYTDPPEAVDWEVSRWDENSTNYVRVFSELQPPNKGILRLAFAPGTHRLQIAFLDRPITRPQPIEVEVQDGMITPVRVSLEQTGTAAFTSKDNTYGPTARGRYGRRRESNIRRNTAFEISAEAGAPVPYAPKEAMTYGR